MAFLHGFLLAFGLILPLGVQNVFVFNQGARQSAFVRALPVVATATLCDWLLILLSVFGVSLLVLEVNWVRWLLIIGGVLFLLYMGWLTWKNAASADQPEKTEEPVAFSPKRQILFAASVSLLNPHALLDTVGVIGTSSLSYAGSDKAGFTTACMLVSLLWFLSLAFAGRLVGRINSGILPLINRISAVIMWGSAVYMCTTLL
ncbi:LysE/ArgO family amino acid transporter [Tumebacillus flagellatus]|uniref:LysE family L-lysine exporter n=1 Tax=Tumebacillus flagellatus TaxID=1157490 RepID=A0A074MG21_9BACL|nr:LysE/ArgO family amino acid transporter [Tumebacillus flagellatus]KEO84647.1 LysE family L-lysine exporter [Tumebacillus flagellatus]